jgi:hypothetical protein
MGFSDGMKTMCESLAQSRSDRDKVMQELHSDFSRDRTERRGGLKRLFGDVHVMIQHFHTGRGKMSKELRQMLEGYFEGIQKNVRGFLREFRTQHKAMSGKQRAELKAFHATLQKDTKALMNQLRERIEEIAGQSQTVRKEARAMMRDYRADFKKARGYWMEFAARMQKSRTSARPMKAGAPTFQARIMAALKGSPEGMTMKEMSYAMGMPEKGLKRALTRMRKEKHLRKRKSTFFAR